MAFAGALFLCTMSACSNASSSTRLRGFPPVVGEAPRILILGSMPSAASIAAQAYYAHPRNRFWPVMGAVFGFDADADYAERLKALRRAGVALWDTIESCERTGSLDTAILRPTPNAVAALLEDHATIARVVLNGAKSADVWRRFGAPTLPPHRLAGLHVEACPSTSPANARWRLEDLVRVWRASLLG